MTMDKAFLAAYSLRLIATCHRRGAHAMGGMAAFIPVKGDEQANAAALEKVRQDKLREVRNGHDGTWVAHPALVPVAMQAFEAMDGPNQLSKMPEQFPAATKCWSFTPARAPRPAPARTSASASNISPPGSAGRGAVPLYNLMEDAATAEISRAQLWQWLHFGAELDDGRMFDGDLFDQLFDEEVGLLQDVPDIDEAAELFREMVVSDDFVEFLTLPAYERLG